jgi:lysine-specific demethylase 8
VEASLKIETKMGGSPVIWSNLFTFVLLLQGIGSLIVADAFDRHELNNNDSPVALSEEELKQFNHLGKLGEQGEILHGKVDELDYFPNGKDFYEHFVRKRKPLIIRGAAKQWPAFNSWKNETYMRSKYGNVLFEVDFTKRYERKPPIKRTITLDKFFDIYKTQDVYLDSAFPQSNLTKDISVPFSLQCEEIMTKVSSIHLLYSNGGTSYVLHQDGYENILTVLSGKKVLLITNSSYSARLHSDEYVTVPGLSPIDPEKVDLVKYPGVAGVAFHEVCTYWLATLSSFLINA